MYQFDKLFFLYFINGIFYILVRIALPVSLISEFDKFFDSLISQVIPDKPFGQYLHCTKWCSFIKQSILPLKKEIMML